MKTRLSIKSLEGQTAEAFIASYTGNGLRAKISTRVTLHTYGTSAEYVVRLQKGRATEEESVFERLADAVEAYNKAVEKYETPPTEPMRFKRGDRVALKNSANQPGGLVIDLVDPVERKYRTDGYKWWVEANFIPWSEWEAKHAWPKR